MMDILTPSLHSGYNKFKPNKASSTTATSIENIAPPSPRDSVDDERSVKEEEDDVDDMIINTTMKHTVTFPYQSPSFISFSEDPSFYLTINIQSLIYWEYPLKSALVLSMILGSTWLTQYYSLLYMVSSLFTIVTFINFIYVNMDYHSQRILTGKPTHTIHHPPSQKLNTSSRRTWLNEEQVNHGCQVMIQLLEGVLEEIIDIVLIQDNVKSGYAIFISFGVWLVANACSMKTMIFLGTLISFSFPRIYLEHHEAIDLFILQQKEKLYQTIASTTKMEILFKYYEKISIVSSK
ncbi:Reticulon-domain-containing protein [Cunninghamella echinulata]|nr:Reticulon-domain-containing protein [Cunninghamella echinulata]